MITSRSARSRADSPLAGHSLWLDDSNVEAAPSNPPLSGRTRADTCIVGGGFCGLWAALRLRELNPDRRVVLVEADVCGGGASGRNGGFVMTWWSKFLSLEKTFGTIAALELAEASAESVMAIGRFCSEHRIESDYRLSGWLWSASSAVQIGAWQGLIDRLDELGSRPFLSLSAAEASSRSGSPVVRGGVFEEIGATVQPAALARGMRRVAMESGTDIHEYTPATGLDISDRRIRIDTPDGFVEADNVLIALGAWTATLLPRAARRIIVVGSDVVATEPDQEGLDRMGLQPGLAVSDSRLMVNYFQRTAGNRVVFGTGGGSLAWRGRAGHGFTGPSSHGAMVERNLRRLLPGLSRTSVSRTWTGPVDRSVSGLPSVWSLDPDGRALVCAGFSGNGVGPSRLVGRRMAEAVSGADERIEGFGGSVAKFPPEPFLSIGGKLVRAAVERRERLEDGGDQASALVRRMASLAPAGLVPVRDAVPEKVAPTGLESKRRQING